MDGERTRREQRSAGHGHTPSRDSETARVRMAGDRKGRPHGIGSIGTTRSIARTVRRRPAKLLYLLGSLGVSFGFIAAVIAIAHAGWFRMPAGVVDQDYVTVLRRSETEALPVSLIDFEQVEALAPEVSWFHVRPKQVDVLDPTGKPRMLEAHLVLDGFFRELGVRAAVGNLAPGASDAPAVVLSDAAWRGVYGGRDVVGTHVQVNDGPALPVIGVTTPDFVGVLKQHPDLWVHNAPRDLAPPMFDVDEPTWRRLDRRWPSVTVFGVVPGGRDGHDLLAGLRGLFADYRFEAGPIRVEGPTTPNPDGTQSVSAMLFDLGVNETDRLELVEGLETEPDLRREVAQKTVWLVGVVVLLLATAFVSLVEFLMAENATREDERRVRIAVGAAPMDVLRAVIAENALLIVAVAVLAWLAFGYSMDVLLRFEPFATYLGEASSGARYAGLAAGGVLLAVAFVVCMTYVSWFVSRPTMVLTGRGRLLRRIVRQILMFVATASLLAVLSLATRYLGDARLSLGFANTGVAVVTAQSNDPGQSWQEAGPVVAAVEATPGIRSAAQAGLHPLADSGNLPYSRVTIVDRPGLDDVPFYANDVTAGYFETIGLEFVAGRVFDAGAENEVVLSRSAADALGGVEAVLGAPLEIDSRMRMERETTVVGVAENVPYGGYVAVDTRVIYRPTEYAHSYQLWLIHAEPGMDVAQTLAASSTFAGWTITKIGTLESLFRKQFIATRSMEIVLSVAAAFALLLALAGVANSLSRRIGAERSRIGIRFALGATTGELTRSYLVPSLRDLGLAGAAVCGLALVVKLAAPAFAAVLTLWLVVPALAGLAGACAMMSHVLVGQMARRSSVSALVHGRAGASGRTHL